MATIIILIRGQEVKGGRVGGKRDKDMGTNRAYNNHQKLLIKETKMALNPYTIKPKEHSLFH